MTFTPKTKSEMDVNAAGHDRRMSLMRGLQEFSGPEPCNFEAKQSYISESKLLEHRSKVSTGISKDAVPHERATYQDWKGMDVPQPPDFSLNRYEPAPPKRNTREATKCWRFGTEPHKKVRFKTKSPDRPPLPCLLLPEKTKSKTFVTNTRLIRPQTAKKKFVTDGQFEKGEYVPPKPHDYRDLPSISKLGLPEMNLTSDTCRLKFKRENRDVVFGLNLGAAPHNWISCAPTHLNEGHMARPWKPQLKWEKGKLFPKKSYPQYTCLPQKGYTEEFTRFPRPKSAYTAFLDRVNAAVTNRVLVEKLASAETRGGQAAKRARKQWSSLANSFHGATPSLSSKSLTPPG